MPDTAAIQILRKIKSARGCRIDDFVQALPFQYMSSDAPPHHYLLEPIVRLIKWGLIQAFEDARIVEAIEIEQNRIHVEVLTFYLSPLVVTMENALGFSFAGPQSIFGEPKRSNTWPQVFVLMPFSPELKPIYEDHIKKVVLDLGLTVGRADDFFSAGSIVHEIWSAINAASIIVADCTGRNPNVFYEIGISHTVGKDTILITQSIDDVPFDLRHLRVIKYGFTPRGMSDLEMQLRLTIGGSLGQEPQRIPGQDSR